MSKQTRQHVTHDLHIMQDKVSLRWKTYDRLLDSYRACAALTYLAESQTHPTVSSIIVSSSSKDIDRAHSNVKTGIISFKESHSHTLSS